MQKNDTALDTTFQALGYSKRRGMIETLSYRPATIAQLAREFDLSLPAMHKHIRLLERAGLIERRKSGRINFVALNPQPLRVAQQWVTQYHTEWSSPHQTLENYIASLKE